MLPPSAAGLTVWTIGHSSRPIEQFVALLQAQEIGMVADVRRFAGSRAHPHFNPEPLEASLAAAGIGYLPFPELGGRRRARPDSVNTVWRNAAFRGYADHMETSEFAAGLDRLLPTARERRVCLLCAEAVWWRCHRSMIADALKAGGALVLHVMEGGKVVEHPYTAPARVVDGRLRYDAAPA